MSDLTRQIDENQRHINKVLRLMRYREEIESRIHLIESYSRLANTLREGGKYDEARRWDDAIQAQRDFLVNFIEIEVEAAATLPHKV